MRRMDGKTYPTVTDDSILGFFGEYRFLSNFERCIVNVDGITFRSSEAAYMAQKTFDENHIFFLALCDDPKEAKKYGRTFPVREDWEEYKSAAMFKVILAKFTQNQNLAQLLRATGFKYLEETNYWNDQYWGVCNGEGKNILGKILMDVRDFL